MRFKSAPVFFAVLAFACFCSLRAPSPVYRLLATIPAEAKYLQTDRLGNVYVLSTSNQLSKYDNAGRHLATLNYKYIGSISSIDASNPLEIYVFYRELNTVVFLDNNLAYRGEINLANKGILQAWAVARSYDNGIWVFDLGDQQLKKLTKDGSLNQQSGNLRRFLNSNKVLPDPVFDNTDRVYLNDPATAWYF